MKSFFLALALTGSSLPLLAVDVGFTFENVVDELGMPTSKMEAGVSLTLNYTDSTIKLHEGRVVSIKMAGVGSGDTYEKVIETKGMPASKIEAGTAAVLRYADATIKLREGKVVSIKMVGAGEGLSLDANGMAKPATVGTGEWTTDYAAALHQAKTGKKKVLLFFTGSDWCGWCKRLDAEVLSTADFKAYAREQLILVKLDFPRNIPQSTQVKARNQKLSEQYQIDGYPTIVVLDSNGNAVGRLGYQPGGPRPFIGEMKKF
jgi:protein disulfide-isomerase